MCCFVIKKLPWCEPSFQVAHVEDPAKGAIHRKEGTLVARQRICSPFQHAQLQSCQGAKAKGAMR